MNKQCNNVCLSNIDVHGGKHEKALKVWSKGIDCLPEQEKAFYGFNWMANSFIVTAARQLSM